MKTGSKILILRERLLFMQQKNMNNTINKKTNIAALTGVRFIAQLCVVISHLSPLPLVQYTLVHAGRAMVAFFFVLSGFVLTYIHFNDFNSHFDSNRLWNYYIARLSRIYPLYFLIMIYCWLVRGCQVNILYYIFAVQAWSGDLKIAFGAYAPGWTLSALFFLYAIFPLLIWGLNKAKLIDSAQKVVWLLLLVFGIIFCLALYYILSGKANLPWSNPASAHRWLYLMPIIRMLDFLIGILAAVYYLKFKESFKFSALMWSLSSYTAIGLYIVFMSCAEILYSAFGYDFTFAPLACLIILGICFNKDMWFTKLLSKPIMVGLGNASFALYLTHKIILPRVLSLANYFSDFLYFIYYGVCILFLVCLSYGIHKFIEMPIHIFLRKKLTLDLGSQQTVFNHQSSNGEREAVN